jgi:chemotaxis regulatin CheY-phosphate phosphatase CheZ
MPDYDRRTAAGVEGPHRLVPLAEEAAADAKVAVEKLENALKVVRQVRREARALVPQSFYKGWMSPRQEGADFHDVFEHVDGIIEDLEEKKLLTMAKRLATDLEELVSETKNTLK